MRSKVPVCVNPKCTRGYPQYANLKKKAAGRCPECGRQTYQISHRWRVR